MGTSRETGTGKGLNQFEGWWADLPEPAGRRAVLLLSRAAAYSYLSKYIAVEITPTIRRIATEVAVGDSLRMVPRVSLFKRAGRLAQERETEVKRAIGAALGWRESTDL